MRSLGVLLIIVSVIIHIGCDKSPTENSGNSSEIIIELFQKYGDSLQHELGEFKFNTNNTINLQETASKDVSLTSSLITIHPETEYPILSTPRVFIILYNTADSTYKSINLRLNQYEALHFLHPNIVFERTVYAFLVSNIDDQIEEPINVIFETFTLADTLTIIPAQHTLDLNVLLSIDINLLDLVVTNQLSMNIFNNSEIKSCVIMTYCYEEVTGSKWNVRIIGAESGCYEGTTGLELTDTFDFYGFNFD